MSRELLSEAKTHLGIIHQMDVLKIITQLKIVSEASEEVDELKGLSKEEYAQLESLLVKYRWMLDRIKIK